MQRVNRLHRSAKPTPYYDYSEKKLDRIIKNGGTFVNREKVVELHLQFDKMELCGYTSYGDGLYFEAKAKQVFVGCTIEEAVRHAKAYLRTVELC